MRASRPVSPKRSDGPRARRCSAATRSPIRWPGCTRPSQRSRSGDAAPPAQVDDDVFSFVGTAGEEVTVTLEAAGADTGSANLSLIDAMSGVDFRRTSREELPTGFTATLPADGEYRVWILELPPLIFIGGEKFSGDYCLTVEASQGAAQTLTALASVEGSPAADAVERKPGRGKPGRPGARPTDEPQNRSQPPTGRRGR